MKVNNLLNRSLYSIKKSKISNKILHFLFPNMCALCDEFISNDALLCINHYKQLKPITQPKCVICSSQTHNQQISKLKCPKCLSKKPFYDSSVILFNYEEVISKIILNLKYCDSTFFVKKLASMLDTKLLQESNNDYDIICPVPLHIKRLKKRKYNQSIIIAQHLSKKLKIKHIPNLLIRVNFDKTQEGLNLSGRINNVKNSFIINPKYKQIIKNKNILLVDDVISSGATVNYCSKILKSHKAKIITTLAIAKSSLRN